MQRSRIYPGNRDESWRNLPGTRTPVQVTVVPGSRATIEAPAPAIIRRRVHGEGLGVSFVEEPIGEIEKVDLHIQYATEPIQQIAEESPDEYRKRLQAHGQVIRATITPTGEKQ